MEDKRFNTVYLKRKQTTKALKTYSRIKVQYNIFCNINISKISILLTIMRREFRPLPSNGRVELFSV